MPYSFGGIYWLDEPFAVLEGDTAVSVHFILLVLSTGVDLDFLSFSDEVFLILTGVDNPEEVS
jgi:hypothetical protein